MVTAAKTKSPEAKKVPTAFETQIGKNTYVVRRLSENPDKWETRKNGKALAELKSRRDAELAALRDGKSRGPSSVKWKPIEDPGPHPYELDDAGFRLEMRALASRIHNKQREVLRADADVKSAKKTLTGREAELNALYGEMTQLADDERTGQGRLNLSNGSGKAGTNGSSAKKKAAKSAKKAPAKK